MNQLDQLKKMLQEQDNMLFIGMVHQGLYGPLRDLNYILMDPNPEFLNEYLTKGWHGIATDIWKKTMLATQPMILPMDMLEEKGRVPPEFERIKDAEDYIRQKLKENPSHEEDPFYYRLGKL